VEQGFVWCGLRPLREIPSPDTSSEVAEFWQAVAKATLFFVGEEYPEFKGNPATAAAEHAAGHQRLVRGLQRGLGRKYICGMTPGWQNPMGGLHGNVDGKPLAFVTSWRQAFIKERRRLRRPRGYAQFSFTGGNLTPKERLNDAIASLHFANDQLA
jgi:hypothetical protein